MRWFRKRKKPVADDPVSRWKNDFSDCLTADYLPSYSVCLSENNTGCRYLAHYAGMTLCSHPDHKRFIPADGRPFNPHEGQFEE